jgi:hypothetical protein
MISGRRLAILLPLLVGPTLAPAPDARAAALDLDAQLAALARPAPATTRFVEVRHSRLLKRPLVTAGTLEYRGPGRLAKRVERPYVEATTIDGEDVRVERAGRAPRRLSLQRAPELRGLLASFGALLGGDRAALERHFTLTLSGDAARWSLTLVPKDPRAAKRIRAVVVDGAADAPRCIAVTEADGDASVTLLDAAVEPPLPAAPTRAALAARCRGTP